MSRRQNLAEDGEEPRKNQEESRSPSPKGSLVSFWWLLASGGAGGSTSIWGGAGSGAAPQRDMRWVHSLPHHLASQRCAFSVPAGSGAPARAQPVQLASLEVVTQSSSFTGLPQ